MPRAISGISKGARAREVTSDPRWAQLVARVAAADGVFVYSVRTTGVYCRPSCGARAPRPENVAFYTSPSQAEASGFRACKRCKPNEPPASERNAALIAKLCRHIEQSGDAPSLDALASHAGLSVYHLHRLFKQLTGLTPKAYADAHRAKRVRDALTHDSGRDRASVIEAVFGAGFSSTGRFYEASNGVLGMTPTTFRKGGIDMKIRFAIGQCSLGAILVAASDKGVCAILLGDDPDELAHDLERRFPKAQLVGADAPFEALVAKVVGLVEAPSIGLDLPLDVRGTAFQQRVWQALRAIPAGTTVSYAELADRLGAKSAVRAVASACGANALAVAIPCHRVVRTDGALSGYRWGVERKRALLTRESRS